MFDTCRFAHSQLSALFIFLRIKVVAIAIRNTHRQLTQNAVTYGMLLRFDFFFCIIWWNCYAKTERNEKQVQYTAARATRINVCAHDHDPGRFRWRYVFANVVVLRQYCAYTHRNSFYDHICAQSADERDNLGPINAYNYTLGHRR